MKKLLLAFVVLSLLLSGCGAAQSPMVEQAAMPAESPSAGAPDRDVASTTTNSGVEKEPEVRKIVYNGSMTLIVTDTDETAARVEELAKSLDGYTANANAFRDPNGIMIYSMTLRVPAEKFDAARAALRGMALRVDNENVNTDDITDQYYDLDARLKTLQATEEQLLSLLEETRARGGKVEDIMSIYRELVSVQTEIESLQGQINRFDKLVALSTLNINIQPDSLATPISTDWRPLETLKNSFSALISVLRGLVDLVIYLVVVVLPVLLILAVPVIIVLLALRWLIRRVRRRGAEKTEQTR